MSDISQTDGPAPASASPAVDQSRQDQNAIVIVDQNPVYDGRLRELFSLVVVNLVLNIATGGFYRFWAKTRLRHYFLSRVSFLSDRLVYTGTGMELFIGFLVILGILAPFYIVIQLLSNFAIGQGVIAFTAVQVAFYVAFMFLFHTAVYRAQRYRLSRVTWRGIRGGQTGSAFIYAIRAMAWSAAVVLTAGFAYPLMRNDLMARRINNARFGQQGFQYAGGATPLYGYWILPWMSALVIAGCIIALFGMLGTANLADGGENMPPEDREILGVAVLKWSPVFFGALGLFLITNIWYRAAEVRHFTGGTSFNNLTFESRLRGLKLFLPYLSYGFLMSLVFGGAMALFIGAMQYFDLAETVSKNQLAATFVGFGLIILLFGAGSLIKPLIVQNFLIRIFCNSLTVKGKIESDKLLQSQMEAPRRGEGLADAFDIDGF